MSFIVYYILHRPGQWIHERYLRLKDWYYYEVIPYRPSKDQYEEDITAYQQYSRYALSEEPITRPITAIRDDDFWRGYYRH